MCKHPGVDQSKAPVAACDCLCPISNAAGAGDFGRTAGVVRAGCVLAGSQSSGAYSRTALAHFAGWARTEWAGLAHCAKHQLELCWRPAAGYTHIHCRTRHRMRLCASAYQAGLPMLRDGSAAQRPERRPKSGTQLRPMEALQERAHTAVCWPRLGVHIHCCRIAGKMLCAGRALKRAPTAMCWPRLHLRHTCRICRCSSSAARVNATSPANSISGNKARISRQHTSDMTTRRAQLGSRKCAQAAWVK